MSRWQRRRDARRRIRRATDALPLPAHPYRDSAIFYALLSGALLGVTYATGGGMMRALAVAAGFFVIATAFSWWRFRGKLMEREREKAEGGEAR